MRNNYAQTCLMIILWPTVNRLGNDVNIRSAIGISQYWVNQIIGKMSLRK